jgi:hypothetical protein
MSKTTKTFYASRSPSTGSSGFTNFIGCDMEKGLAEVFKEHPKAVVIDGSDDWYAPDAKRPEVWSSKIGLVPLAWFQSGISGISKSGIVVLRKDLRVISKCYKSQYGIELTTANKIHFPKTKPVQR